MLSRIETAAATIRANTYYGGAAILPIHFSVAHPILGSANNTLFIRCVNNTVIEVTAKIEVVGFTTTVQRIKGASGWGPFEYENPYMFLGVEYRTTERYMEKPVYVKVVDCGAMPNTTTKVVSHGVANIDQCISATGITIISTGDTFSIPFASMQDGMTTGCSFSRTQVRVWSAGDDSTANANVLIKYTKTTD